MLYNLNNRSSLKHVPANIIHAHSAEISNDMNIEICECLPGPRYIGTYCGSLIVPSLRYASYDCYSPWIIGEITCCAAYSLPAKAEANIGI
jgi:hypothetical protein